MSGKYYFKTQFPNGKHSESYKVSPEVSDFSTLNLDIGWVLYKFNTKFPKNGSKVLTKRCHGAVFCPNDGVKSGKRCPFFNKVMRPRSKDKLIAEQLCKHCRAKMTHIPCHIEVKFILANSSCTVQCDDIHTHDTFNTKHLSGDQRAAFVDRVSNDPFVTPRKCVVGIKASTGELVAPVYEINPILGNQHRVKDELKKARELLGIAKKHSFLGEFENIQTQFQDYIIYSQVAHHSEYLIVFSSPDMKKYELPFDTQPIITDVTYKAIVDNSKKYLCSSVIYVPELKRSIVFYQAIIGGLDAKHFAKYFIKMFHHFKFDKFKFMGMLMDFSSAQRLGFLHAFNYYFDNSADGSGTNDQLKEGLSYLKGCYMHWMQSVQRIISNHAVVPKGTADDFKRRVYNLRNTDSEITFLETVLRLSIDYPACKRWLSWWLQPTVSSLIFKYNSAMKADLSSHRTRSANSVEAFHSTIYTTMSNNTNLSTSFTQLLGIARSDGYALRNYYENGITPYYGNKKRPYRSKELKSFYAKSDSRAPDNSEAIFAEPDSQVRKRDLEKQKEEFRYFENIIKASSKRKRENQCDKRVYDNTIKEDYSLTEEETMELDELDLEPGKVNDPMPFKEDPADSEMLETIPSQYGKILEEIDNNIDQDTTLITAEEETSDTGYFDCLDYDFDIDFIEMVPSQNNPKTQHDYIDVDDYQSEPHPIQTFSDVEPSEIIPNNKQTLVIAEDSRTRSSVPQNESTWKLNTNFRNSCWIDAPFELLFRSICPDLHDYLCLIRVVDTDFDEIMFHAYKEYTEDRPITGNQKMRNFFWKVNDRYIEDSMQDVYDVLEFFIRNLSQYLKYLFTFRPTTRFGLCSNSIHHSTIEEGRHLSIITFGSHLPTMGQYFRIKKKYRKLEIQKQELDKLDKEFEEAFWSHYLLEYNQKDICVDCNERCRTTSNLITYEQYPPFFFIADPANFSVVPTSNEDKDSKNDKYDDLQDKATYFPQVLNFKLSKYTLHGRIYSTHTTGAHYFSVGKVELSDKSWGVYKFDNLNSQCVLLENLSSLNEHSKALSTSRNTVLVCYRQMD